MGIEGYGGRCPKCERAMLNKYESSGMGFMFDACPWCGFAYGTQDGVEITDALEIWSSIFEHYSSKSHYELIQKLNLVETVSEQESDFYPSLFLYEEHKDLKKSEPLPNQHKPKITISNNEDDLPF